MSAALVAAKFALGPVLLPQAKWVQRNALRLPEAAGPRQGVVGEGEPKLRVLVVGDSSAAGVGVADQAQALALPLAKEVSTRIGGAVAWHLVAQTGIGSAEAIDLVTRSDIQRPDVAVIVLGVNDVTSQTGAAHFIANLGRLVKVIGASRTVFSGLPPMHLLSAVPHPLRWYLGKYSAWLDAALRVWCAAEHLGYCSSDWSTDPRMLAEDGYHPGAALYPQWAARLAEVVASPVRPELVEGLGS
ncbi:MAG TPA: SGNH/GDSL hydrolase family protein [Ramlibacter sp.]|nr:SGNH/GDSL hydrolase family protein [Ramlibacter sp.]